MHATITSPSHKLITRPVKPFAPVTYVAVGCAAAAYVAARLSTAPSRKKQSSRRAAMKNPAVAQGGIVSNNIQQEVAVQIEKPSWTSRKLYASIRIDAPVELVWAALTDYDGLANFIPSLVENRCLQRRPNGAVLYQVGAQDVALGVKFKASCTLDCVEYIDGVPMSLCSTSDDGNDGVFPYPKTCSPNVPAQDITFYLVEGDFKDFKGIWRMQAIETGTLLCYSLYVQPQAWLPVAVIQNRIEREVKSNLAAVQRYVEMQLMNKQPA